MKPLSHRVLVPNDSHHPIRSISKLLSVLFFTCALTFLAFVTAAQAQIIPTDRTTSWVPGMMSRGGIPSRTTICATVAAGGSSDRSADIQAAIDGCPEGQVVSLGAGTFVVNNYVLVNKGITLRGAGPTNTFLTKTDGAPPRTSTLVDGTTGIYAPDVQNYNWDTQPIIIVG